MSRNKKNNFKKTLKKQSKRIKSTFNKEELEGRIAMTKDGNGFVIVEGRDTDIFVPAQKMRGALNGDVVKVVTIREKGRQVNGKPKRIEGEVFYIIERSNRPYVGILQIAKHDAWVIIENRSMPYDVKVTFDNVASLFSIPVEEVQMKAKELSGVKVAVRVTGWPRKSNAPLGEIFDILGTPGENDTEMHAILAEFGLPYRFEPQVEEAANSISDKITKKEIADRRDFRDVTTFTIDPADAKDFDDALSYKILENGNVEIGVHIADVTHYVTPNSVIDKVGYERGTSVYLVDRTVPMLPEKLSNNLCSLRPNEEKLCFSVLFEMTDKAKIVNTWFGRSIIKSNFRFDYDQAQEIIMTGVGEYAKELQELNKLATIIRKKRIAAGAISFERPEMKVEIDKDGKPISVYEKITKEANWLIEEFMLLANKSVAEYIGKAKIKKTFVYRIHENPNDEKVSSLRKFVKLFGYSLKEEKKLSSALNTLLGEVKGKPEANAIEMLALRSMSRARYSTDNVGHYGLAFDYYTHFTSPIRRYPDMMVHRLLAAYLGGASSQDKDYYEQCCKYASDREQVAVEAERASIKYKLVEFMQDKIGKIFDGTISGLTEWGLYVEIEPTKIEGMVALRDIKSDYFVFDEETYSVIGKGKGIKYTLGDKVKVKVARASLEQKLIDYELVTTDEV